MIKRLALLNLILCLLRPDGAASASNLPHIQTVFIILLENADWAQVYNNASAPYLNQTILPQASFCNHYLNVPDNHPSEPNYLWLECGTNFGLYNDDPPAVNHQGTTNHLVTLLNRAGISWKAYAEGIDGNSVPLTDTNEYAPKHCPFVFF